MKITVIFTRLTLLFCLFGSKSFAQRSNPADSIMITIFLKHQQDKNLDSLQIIEKKNKNALIKIKHR